MQPWRTLTLACAFALAGACTQPRGGDCTNGEECDAELVCEARGEGTSVCVPLPGAAPRLLREPCRIEALCGPGAVCLPPRSGGETLCLLLDGELCFEDAECGSDDCDFRCGNTPICEAGAGCACAQDDDCDVNDACTGSECGRTCEPRVDRGAACLTRVDGPCDVRAGCIEGLECAQLRDDIVDGVCLPDTDRAAGELCNRDDECTTGACVNDACT